MSDHLTISTIRHQRHNTLIRWVDYIVIVMGNVTDISQYYQLSDYVYQWPDYQYPPANMTNAIIDSFAC